MKYEFLTSLSAEKCKDNLRDSMQSGQGKIYDFIWNDPNRIAGRASRKNNRFWVRPPGLRKDAFAPIFHGEFINTVNGTVIEGKFSLNKFVLIFPSFWELAVIFVLVIGIFARKIELILVPIVMTLFWMLMMFGGVRKRKQKTIDFIIKTFNAKETETIK